MSPINGSRRTWRLACLPSLATITLHSGGLGSRENYSTTYHTYTQARTISASMSRTSTKHFGDEKIRDSKQASPLITPSFAADDANYDTQDQHHVKCIRGCNIQSCANSPSQRRRTVPLRNPVIAERGVATLRHYLEPAWGFRRRDTDQATPDQ